MPKVNYVEIVNDQRIALLELMKEPVIPRRPMERIELLNPCAQVVVGMRRCGKSVLCRMALQAHPEIKYGYINFDDEKLKDLKAEDLNDVLEAIYVVYGEDIQVLFMDEIQDVPAWELFVNRLLRGKLHLLVTGSNSKLLSSELATHLTGRHIPIELFAFSFLEYRQFLKRGEVRTTLDRAQLRRDYDRYFDCGGLPETFSMADVRGYIHTLYDAILYRDILRRYKIRNIKTFTDVARLLMEGFAQEVSYRNIANRIGVTNIRTIQNYIGYLEGAYLIQTVNHYSTHAHERLQIGKVYATDPGYITHFTGISEGDEAKGRRLENIVFVQLRALREWLDYEIYYYRDQSHEIDFVLRRSGSPIRLVQVSYSLANEKTRSRELSALFEVGRKLKCEDLVLITDHENGEETRYGMTVRIVDVTTWLLEAPNEKPVSWGEPPKTS
jgi:predicted AAA+ superfamily ATPase